MFWRETGLTSVGKPAIFRRFALDPRAKLAVLSSDTPQDSPGTGIQPKSAADLLLSSSFGCSLCNGRQEAVYIDENSDFWRSLADFRAVFGTRVVSVTL